MKKNDIFFRKSNLSENEWDRLNLDLNNILNNEFCPNRVYDINQQAYIISDSLQIVRDKFMPIRKQPNNSRKQNKPWLTAGLKNSSVKKNDLFAKAKYTNAPEDYQNYKTFLNLFTKLKKKHKMIITEIKLCYMGMIKLKRGS